MDKCTLNKEQWADVAENVGYVLKIIQSLASGEKDPQKKEVLSNLEADLMAAMSACFYVGNFAAEKVVFAAVKGT